MFVLFLNSVIFFLSYFFCSIATAPFPLAIHTHRFLKVIWCRFSLCTTPFTAKTHTWMKQKITLYSNQTNCYFHWLSMTNTQKLDKKNDSIRIFSSSFFFNNILEFRFLFSVIFYVNNPRMFIKTVHCRLE